MFAIIACKGCQEPWAVELRNAGASCPRCQKRNEIRKRTRLWEGPNARDAQSAAVHLRTQMAKGIEPEIALKSFKMAQEDAVPRHDSPIDAAAAKARAVTNKSQRADAVALWLTRLVGDVDHMGYLDALERAGLERTRGEKEIVRMLAGDVIFEPQAGRYRCLDA